MRVWYEVTHLDTFGWEGVEVVLYNYKRATGSKHSITKWHFLYLGIWIVAEAEHSIH